MQPSRHAVSAHARLWQVSAGLPPLCWAAAVFVNVDAPWQALSVSVLRVTTPDALLYTAGVTTLAAPLAGVLTASSRTYDAVRRSRVAAAVDAAWPLVIAILTFAGISALLTLGAIGDTEPGTFAFVVTSHATLAAVALGLAVFGAFCGATFRDPLDAIACSMIVVLGAGGGLLVAGAAVAEAPKILIDIGLAASPLVAITSAAHIDILRMDALYRLSPLAHLQADYPAWYAACAWYLLVAFICFVGLTWRVGSWRTADTR